MAHRAGLDRYAARLLGLCRRSAVNTGCAPCSNMSAAHSPILSDYFLICCLQSYAALGSLTQIAPQDCAHVCASVRHACLAPLRTPHDP